MSKLILSFISVLLIGPALLAETSVETLRGLQDQIFKAHGIEVTKPFSYTGELYIKDENFEKFLRTFIREAKGPDKSLALGKRRG